MNDAPFFHVLRVIVYCSSPVVFFVGVLLVMYGNYRKIEQTLGKEAGITKRIIPVLENNIFTFQEWLLQKHTMVGLICMVAALIIFFLLRQFCEIQYLRQGTGSRGARPLFVLFGIQCIIGIIKKEFILNLKRLKKSSRKPISLLCVQIPMNYLRQC